MVGIKAAAINAHGVVFWAPRPARHGDLIKAMAKLGVPTPINGCDGGGFMLNNSDGTLTYLNREEAKCYAYACGQISKERFDSTRVFCTEDLW